MTHHEAIDLELVGRGFSLTQWFALQAC